MTRQFAGHYTPATMRHPHRLLCWLDGIAMDSLGNIYTGEVDDGKRVQKFRLVNGDGVRRFRPHD